jgi:hypothetical protein
LKVETAIVQSRAPRRSGVAQSGGVNGQRDYPDFRWCAILEWSHLV